MKNPKLSDYKVARLTTTEYQNQRFEGEDFSAQKIEHLRFLGCTFTNCSFDNSFLRDLRMWNTTIRNCTFRNADLRNSSLGGILEGRVNHFESVDFSEADLRGTAHGVATFADCQFDHANLLKVDFQGSRFARCRFSGLLRSVQFYDHAFQEESFEPNRMENVDLSDAQLRFVGFRRLALETVKLPRDKDHAIIPNYPAFLDYALSRVGQGSSNPERRLKSTFELEKRWIGPRRVGVINRLDLLEYTVGTAVLELFDQLLASAPGFS